MLNHLNDELLFTHVFEQAQLAIAIVSSDDIFLKINPFFSQMLSYSEEELESQSVSRIIHPDDYPLFNKNIKNSIGKKLPPFHIRLKKKDGSILHGELFVFAFDKSQTYIIQFKDLTEKKKLENHLHSYKQEYERLIEYIQTPILIHDGKTIVFANQAVASFLGFSETKKMIGQDLFRYIAPHSIQEMKNLLQKIYEEGHTYCKENIQFLRIDGKKINVLQSSSLILFRGKKYVQSIFHDTSQTTTIEQSMATNYRRFHRIFIEAKVAIVLLDAVSGQIIDCNPAFETFIGYSKEELLKMSLTDISHPDHLLYGISLLKKILDGEISFYQIEKKYITKNGQTVWGLLTLSMLAQENSLNKHMVIGIIQDITKQKAIEEELHEANRKLTLFSYQDGLTGVFNRRYFNEMIEVEFRRAIRESIPISVILFDIDFFKSYNDTYGHCKGDKCLQRIAKAAQKIIKRPGDFVARYGGEEFAVVLPNTHASGAVKVAEDIRQAILNLKIRHKASPISKYVTVSLGVATKLPERGENYRRLIEMADKALYEAKEKNRNSVQMYRENDDHKKTEQS